jgi:phosphoglycerate kinase
MRIKSVKEADVKGKRVLVRADFNVPIVPKMRGEGEIVGHVEDGFRVEAALPTVEHLAKQGAKVILITHYGRPQEGVADPELSLEPVARFLADRLLRRVFPVTCNWYQEYPENKLLHTCYYLPREAYHGQKQHDFQADEMHEGDIVLLENIRFYPGEHDENPQLARRLSSLGELFVNEAFSVNHHQGDSVSLIPRFLPSYAGMLLEKEIQVLSSIIHRPAHPFVVIMGGMKISEKAEPIENLSKHVDVFLLGGGLGSLFLKAKGYEIGKSRIEEGAVPLAREILRHHKPAIQLPRDVVVARTHDDKHSVRVRKVDEIKAEDAIFDIGPETIREYSRIIKSAKTLVWNGPLGMFEIPRFSHGSIALARIFAGRAGGKQAFGIIGGGETIDVFQKSGMMEYVDHVSTAGGAMLEFLAGKKLPGIEALKQTS